MQSVKQKHTSRSLYSLTLVQPSIPFSAVSLLCATRVFFGVICHPRVRVTEVRHRHQDAPVFGVHHGSTIPRGEGTAQGFFFRPVRHTQ